MDTLPGGVTSTSYRLVFIGEKLCHTISFGLRGSTQIPICIHQLGQETYRWLLLKSFVGPAEGDSWCILPTSPECSDCSRLVTEHITDVGIKLLSLEDLMSTASQSKYCQAESDRFFQPVFDWYSEDLITLKPPTQRAKQEIHLRSLIDTETVAC
jgi:hypothetical protein